MAALRAALIILGVAPAAAVGRSEGQGFLARDGMRPEVVALALGKVEDEWKNQYRLYVECNQTAASEAEARRCLDAPHAFEKSCAKIVGAMVQASGGNRDSVHEYMADVCSEPELNGWRRGRCEILAATVLAGMTPDQYMNRETLNAQPLCVSFWSRFATEEASLMAKERAAVEEKEKAEQKEREEAEKKLAEEKAEEDRRLAEEKAQEEKEAAEAAAEEKRKEEAERAAAEEAAAKFAAEEEKKAAANNTAAPATSVAAPATNATAQAVQAVAVPSNASNATAPQAAVKSNATVNATK